MRRLRSPRRCYAPRATEQTRAAASETFVGPKAWGVEWLWMELGGSLYLDPEACPQGNDLMSLGTCLSLRCVFFFFVKNGCSCNAPGHLE